jgi:hypothetical protein
MLLSSQHAEEIVQVMLQSTCMPSVRLFSAHQNSYRSRSSTKRYCTQMNATLTALAPKSRPMTVMDNQPSNVARTDALVRK